MNLKSPQMKRLRLSLQVIAAITFILPTLSYAESRTHKIFTPLSTQLLDAKQWDLAKTELEKIVASNIVVGTSEELAQVHASLARCIQETQGATQEAELHLSRAIELSKNPRFRLTTFYKLASNQQTQAKHAEAHKTLETYIHEYNRFITPRSLRELHFLAATSALKQIPSKPELAVQHLNILLATPKLRESSPPSTSELSQLILQLPQPEITQVIDKALQQIQTPPSTLVLCFTVLSEQMKNPELNVSASVENLITKSNNSTRLPHYHSIALEYYLLKKETQRAQSLASSILSSENSEEISRQAAQRSIITLDFLDGKFNQVVRSTNIFLSKWPNHPPADHLRLQLAQAQITLLELSAATKTLDQIENPELSTQSKYLRAKILFLRNQFADSQQILEQITPEDSNTQLQCQSLLLLGRCHSILNQNQKALRTLGSAKELAQQQDLTSLEQEAHFEILAHLYQQIEKDETEHPRFHHEKIAEAYRNYLNRFPNSEYGCQMIHLAFDSLTELEAAEFAQDALKNAIAYAIQNEFEAGLENAFYHLSWLEIEKTQGASNLIKQLSSELNDTRNTCLLHALTNYYKLQLEQSRSSWGARLHHLAATRNIYANLQQKLTNNWLPSYLLNDLAKELNRSKTSAALSETLCQRAQQSSIPNQRALARLLQAQSARIDSNKISESTLALGVQSADFLSHNPTFSETALAEQLELLALSHNHAVFLTKATAFLKRFPVSSHKARVRLLIARSHIEQDQIDRAIPQLNQIFTNHTTQLEVSAPALNTLCTISWNRNNPASNGQASDKQVAYQLGHRYLNTIQSTPEWKRNTPEIKKELTELQQKVSTWEQSEEVTPVKDLLHQLYKSKFD